jgi:hypothetical protein
VPRNANVDVDGLLEGWLYIGPRMESAMNRDVAHCTYIRYPTTPRPFQERNCDESCIFIL